MNPEERKRLNTLCKRIKDERDPRVFSMLLKELDELLDATWAPPPPPHPKSKGKAAGGNDLEESTEIGLGIG